MWGAAPGMPLATASAQSSRLSLQLMQQTMRCEKRALAQYTLVPVYHSDYDPIYFVTMLNEASIYRD